MKWWNDIRMWVKLVIAVVLVFIVTVFTMLAVNNQSLKSAREKTKELSYSYLSILADVYTRDLRDIINAGVSLQYNRQINQLFEQADVFTVNERLFASVKPVADMIMLNGDILDVVLFTADRQAFYCGEMSSLAIYQSLCSNILTKPKATMGSFFLPPNRDNHSYRYSGAQYLYAVDVYSYPKPQGNRELLGTIVLACKLSNYNNIVVDDIALRISDGDYILLNQNFTDDMRRTDNVLSKRLLYGNWLMELCYLSGDGNGAAFPSVLVTLIAILLLSVVMVYLLFFFEVQRPLGKLMDELNCVGMEKSGVTVCPQYDIGQICKHINVMLEAQLLLAENNERYVKNQYELLMRQRQAQVSALRSQINPHFLYNTLECINGMATVHHIEPIKQIAVSMANIFRYSIQSSDTVPLCMEMSIISDYGRIISTRYNGKYQMHMDVDQELQEFYIPRMILQPLVENAVEHGFRQKSEGEVWVCGYSRDGYAVLEVINNGTPIDSETLAILRSRLVAIPDALSDACTDTGIGINNVVRRLQLFYGELFHIEIEIDADKRTIFRLFLPKS